MVSATTAIGQASLGEDPVSSADPSRSRATARRFVVWLLLAAVVPFPVFAVLSAFHTTDASAQATLRILFLLSVAHGGLSGLFFLDQRYRSHMAPRYRYYYGAAAAIAVVSLAGVGLLGEPFLRCFVVIYIAWTIVHFARQNWGVICLTALATGDPKPGRLESVALQLACIGGAIGVLRDQIHLDGSLPAGLGLVLLGLGLSIVVAFRQIATGAPLLRIGMTLAIGGFFLPVFLFGPRVGFVTIGAIHGAQYAIIMSVLAADRRQGSSSRRIVGMVGMTVLYVELFLLLSGPGIRGAWVRPAQVLLDSVVVWHFLLDAGLWRLRHPFQRQAVAQSFPFLFAGRQAER